jgi:hypothetical protein
MLKWLTAEEEVKMEVGVEAVKAFLNAGTFSKWHYK